ncbi:MAG: tRNA1(Val) (adenine(37)-N6)-methyltransferase [Nitrospirota bacterium]
MESITHDSISLRGAGVVYVAQPKTGFRFTQDSILLADFCSLKSGDRVLEPGAGTGVISLLLAKKFPAARFVADEVEPIAYGLLRRNIETNGLSERIVPLDRDARYLNRSFAQSSFDIIVANPPYRKAGHGRTSPSAFRQTARQEPRAPLAAWLNLHKMLKNGGRYFLVFPAPRAGELMAQLRKKKIEPKRLRFVHPRLHKPASLVLIEAVKAAGIGMEVLPPLIVHGESGGYSEEMRQVYELPQDSPSSPIRPALHSRASVL